MSDSAQIPKIVLHDHLDGGMRPQTVIDLAAENGYDALPTRDAYELEAMLLPTAGDLESYLQAFTHPVGVLQSQAALERAAFEAASDWVSDGVVYGEVRFAPELHTRNGLSFLEACCAVLRGLSQVPVTSRLIVTAMRHTNMSLEAARTAAKLKDSGVVGFDLAGPERGWPLAAHASAIAIARDAGLGISLHAGEAEGPAAVVEALELGAARIGHGVSAARDAAVMQRLIDTNTLLEVCLTSNLQTGVAESLHKHPVGILVDAGVPVSIQVDNRTVSSTTASQELDRAASVLGWTTQDKLAMTHASLIAAFADDATKKAVAEMIGSRYKLS
jgi:adenosine deaminase